MATRVHVSLGSDERRALGQALRDNVEKNAAIILNPSDTTFYGSVPDTGDVEDAEVINAIRSVPCHY